MFNEVNINLKHVNCKNNKMFNCSRYKTYYPIQGRRTVSDTDQPSGRVRPDLLVPIRGRGGVLYSREAVGWVHRQAYSRNLTSCTTTQVKIFLWNIYRKITHIDQQTRYCEIIYIHWTFNFMYFMGRAMHKCKIPTKYLFTLVILHIVWNPRI